MGCSSATQYYTEASCEPLLHRVRVPMLFVSAHNEGADDLLGLLQGARGVPDGAIARADDMGAADAVLLRLADARMFEGAAGTALSRELDLLMRRAKMGRAPRLVLAHDRRGEDGGVES